MSDGKTRREFLETTACAGVGCALLASCGGGGGGDDDDVVGDDDGGGPPGVLQPDADGKVFLAFADFPELMVDQGFKRVKVDFGGTAKDVGVVRLDASTVNASNQVCTHAGCTVGAFSAANLKYTCPCHGSQYDAAGLVLRGPATRALTPFDAVLEADGIRITVIT